jgi:hypothetical protein
MDHWFRNLERIEIAKIEAKHNVRRRRLLRILYNSCILTLIVILIAVSFFEQPEYFKSIIGFIGLGLLLIMILFFKRVVRNNVFHGFNNYPYQNPNRIALEKPYFYVECIFKRGIIEESFFLQNKFLTKQDAFDFLRQKVEIECNEWCIVEHTNKVFGYIHKERDDLSFLKECDIEFVFQIHHYC